MIIECWMVRVVSKLLIQGLKLDFLCWHELANWGEWHKYIFCDILEIFAALSCTTCMFLSIILFYFGYHWNIPGFSKYNNTACFFFYFAFFKWMSQTLCPNYFEIYNMCQLTHQMSLYRHAVHMEVDHALVSRSLTLNIFPSCLCLQALLKCQHGETII